MSTGYGESHRGVQRIGQALLAVCATLCGWAAAGDDDPSTIRSDETVVFFPTAAHRNADDDGWVAAVHGWIYEPERDSRWRREAIRLFADSIGLEPDKAVANPLFVKRAGAFICDNERGKDIGVRIAGKMFVCDASEKNGHFTGTFKVSDAQLDADAGKTEDKPGVRSLRFTAVVDEDDDRTFAGRVLLVPPTGVSVISDIDDTLKVSDVHHRKRLLQRSFAEPYVAVDGMAKLYQRWQKSGAAFHYITSSPWQLGEPLQTFMADAGFPPGTFHMRSVRLKDRTVLNLFDASHRSKVEAIKQLLDRYPKRRFILVGDSSERDPEIYGRIAAEHAEQVMHVYIRDLGHHGDSDERWRDAFADLPAARWTAFKDVDALADARLPDLSR